MQASVERERERKEPESLAFCEMVGGISIDLTQK